MSPLLLLIQTLIGGAAQLLESQKNKTAQDIGLDIALADQIALSIFQKTAEVKGLTIDWTDPDAVLAYIQTLKPFVAIPEPGAAPPPITQ